VAEDQGYDGREDSRTHDQPGAEGSQISSAEVGDAQKISEARALGEEAGPSDEELDAREEQIGLKRRPMGPTPPPGARAALTEPEPPMEEQSETRIDGLI